MLVRVTTANGCALGQHCISGPETASLDLRRLHVMRKTPGYVKCVLTRTARLLTE